MAKSFKNLRAKMSPAAKERSKEIARELRGALDVSQEELAELLNKKQAAIRAS